MRNCARTLMARQLIPALLVSAVLALVVSSCGPKWLPYEFPTEDGLEGPGQPANLVVTSEPSGARVILDGVDTGQNTPATVTGVSGSLVGDVHVLRLTKAGYFDYNTLVTVYDGRQVPSTSVAATLHPTTENRGSIRVETMPAGASVFLNGADAGQTAPCTLTNIGPSSHILEARLAGYETRRENVVLRAGEELTVQLQLRQEGTIPVSGTVFESTQHHLVVGAEVRIEGTNLVTTTTQQGSYAFANVPPGTYDITARKVTADGTTLTGARRDVVVSADDVALRTANIVLAPEGTHGRIIGVITSSQGRPIEGATVYADDGGVVLSATTDASGAYRITDLPSGEYIVVASAQDYQNNVRESVVVGAQREVTVNLALTPMSLHEARRPETPEFDGLPQALTYPNAQSVRASQYLAVREMLVRDHGLPPDHPQVRALACLRTAWRSAGVRAFPPANSNIEVDVFWLTNVETDLAGYIVFRSADPDYGFTKVQVIRDPNVLFLADLDPTLGADETVHYKLSAFTTLGFESQRSESVAATPLDRLELVAPEEAATLASTPPEFSWEYMPRARAYEVVVWDAMPDFDTPATAHVAWRSDALPGDTESVAYGTGEDPGDTLRSGQTYYWAVVAYDAPSYSDATALSVSQIRSFVVP